MGWTPVAVATKACFTNLCLFHCIHYCVKVQGNSHLNIQTQYLTFCKLQTKTALFSYQNNPTYHQSTPEDLQKMHIFLWALPDRTRCKSYWIVLSPPQQYLVFSNWTPQPSTQTMLFSLAYHKKREEEKKKVGPFIHRVIRPHCVIFILTASLKSTE